MLNRGAERPPAPPPVVVQASAASWTAFAASRQYQVKAAYDGCITLHSLRFIAFQEYCGRIEKCSVCWLLVGTLVICTALVQAPKLTDEASG